VLHLYPRGTPDSDSFQTALFGSETNGVKSASHLNLNPAACGQSARCSLAPVPYGGTTMRPGASVSSIGHRAEGTGTNTRVTTSAEGNMFFCSKLCFSNFSFVFPFFNLDFCTSLVEKLCLLVAFSLDHRHTVMQSYRFFLSFFFCTLWDL